MNDSVSDLQQLAKMNPTKFKLEFQSLICERNENIQTKKAPTEWNHIMWSRDW